MSKRLLAIALAAILMGCGSEPDGGPTSSVTSPLASCQLDFTQDSRTQGSCVFRGFFFRAPGLRLRVGAACGSAPTPTTVYVSDGATVVFAVRRVSGLGEAIPTWLLAASVDSPTTATFFAWATMDDMTPRPTEGQAALVVRRNQPPSGLPPATWKGSAPDWTGPLPTPGPAAPEGRFEGLSLFFAQLAGPEGPEGDHGCRLELVGGMNNLDPAFFESFASANDPDTADMQAAAREFLALVE